MMHLKASGSEEANKTDGTGNTAINEFNGAVVKVPSKTKGKRSQRSSGTDLGVRRLRTPNLARLSINSIDSIS